jgi:hypothetical protein
MMKKLLLICAFLLLILSGYAQERVSTVGLQFKPLFSSRFFGTGPQTLTQQSFTYEIQPRFGYVLGAVIRKGYTNTLSLEFGLNYAVRNYNLAAFNNGIGSSDRLKIVGYEIPVSQLIFIRLSEYIYMNASAGICLNMFPSDVFEESENFLAYAGRNSIVTPSLLANLGFEYRTPKSGYFYFGTSLNRPFSDIFDIAIDYSANNFILNTGITSLRGSYLSIDLRYFFAEDPEKKSSKKKRNE